MIRRLVTAVRVMRSQRPTLPELAREMGCCERTARRYIETLELASVPVKRHGPHFRIERDAL